MLLLCGGLISIGSEWDSISKEWKDNRNPVQLPLNSVRNDSVNQEVFLTGKLENSTEILRDPVFPVKIRGLYLERNVSVYYSRNQTYYKFAQDDPVYYKGPKIKGPSKLCTESGVASKFGRDLEDSMGQVPEFVYEIKSILPNIELRPKKIFIGKYYISQENHPEHWTDDQPYEISQSTLDKYLASKAGDDLKDIMKKFRWIGPAILPDEPSCLLFYKNSEEKHVEGDTLQVLIEP